MAVTPHSSVDGFFREVLVESLERRGLDTAEHTEHYLVGLLGHYARKQIVDKPLGLILAESASDPAERVKTLKEVGDTSLYLVGFFAESIERQLVKADYYVDLGSAAYAELAARLNGSSVREVYDDLADNFPRFVDVLADIRQQVNFGGADIGQLFEQWMRTRSEWIEARLRAMGVLVSGSDDIQ